MTEFVQKARKDLLEKIRAGSVTIQYAQAAMSLYETAAFLKLAELYTSTGDSVTPEKIEQVLEDEKDAYMLAWLYNYYEDYKTPRAAAFRNLIRDRIAGIYNDTSTNEA